MIAIKNSKESYDCLDWAIVTEKEEGGTVAVIIRFPETTCRRQYPGENAWDCFQILPIEGIIYKEGKGDETKIYPLGRRDGVDIGVKFYWENYTSSFGNVYNKPISIKVKWYSEDKEGLIDLINSLDYKCDPFVYQWGKKEKKMSFIEENIVTPKRGRDRLVQSEEDAPIEPFLPNE